MTREQFKKVLNLLEGIIGGRCITHLHGGAPDMIAYYLDLCAPWMEKCGAFMGVGRPGSVPLPPDHKSCMEGIRDNLVEVRFGPRDGDTSTAEDYFMDAWAFFRGLHADYTDVEQGQPLLDMRPMLIREVSDFSGYVKLRDIADKQEWRVDGVFGSVGTDRDHGYSPDFYWPGYDASKIITDDFSESWLETDAALAYERWYGENRQPFKVVPAPTPAPTREERILGLMLKFKEGGTSGNIRTTRSGKPYVRGLEKMLGFDITSRERNRLWQEVQGG